MKLIGFRSVNWEPHGYKASIPADARPFATITPTILYRAGSTPAFGPSQIGERSIPCEFSYRGSLPSFEAAWDNLITLLNAYDTREGQLRGQRLNGSLVKCNAILTLPNVSSFFGINDITTFPMIFISNDLVWTGL